VCVGRRGRKGDEGRRGQGQILRAVSQKWGDTGQSTGGSASRGASPDPGSLASGSSLLGTSVFALTSAAPCSTSGQLPKGGFPWAPRRWGKSITHPDKEAAANSSCSAALRKKGPSVTYWPHFRHSPWGAGLIRALAQSRGSFETVTWRAGQSHLPSDDVQRWGDRTFLTVRTDSFKSPQTTWLEFNLLTFPPQNPMCLVDFGAENCTPCWQANAF